MKTSKNLPPRATATAAEDAEPRAWYPLVLIFAVLALGICAGGIFSYRHYERHFRTEIEQQLAAITELKVEEIVHWRQERLLDAHYLRRTPYVARRALDVLTQPQSLATRQMFTAWLESMFAEGPYEQVLLLDEGLNVGLVYPERTSGVLRDVARRAAQEALSSQQVVLADLHRETEDGPVYLSLMVPLVVRPEGTGDKVQAAGKGSSAADRSAGLLVLQINAQKHLYPLIQRWPTPSRTAETLLVRSDGNQALFLNEIKFQTNTALKLRISLANTNVAAVKAVLGQEGIVDAIDYRGVPVVAALRAIPDSPWAMVARMDTAEVYAPLRDRLWLTILLMGALLLGAAASVGLVWRHQRVQFYRERHAAAAAQARLWLILESSLNEIYVFEPESLRFEYVNRGALRNLGYTSEAMQTMTPLDLKPEFTEVSFRAALAPLLRHEQEQRLFNTVHRRADGSLYPVEVHLQLVEVPGQRMFLAVIVNITERKLAEAAKQESEARFQTMANSMLQLAWIAKADGFIFWYNQRWYDYTGTTPEQMEGWGWQSVHDPAALPQVMQKWTGCIASGQPFEMEFPLRGADGQFRTFLTRGQPLKDSSGNVVQWFGTNTDVDALRKAAEALRHSEEFNRRIVESSHDCIKVLDLDANLLSMSEGGQRLLGIADIAPYLNHSWVQFWHEADRPRVSEAVATALAGNVGRFQAFCPAVTGEPRWWDVIVTPICDAAGQPRQLLAVSRDVTAHQQAEAALKTSEERFRTAAENITDVVYDWDIKEKVDWYGDIDGITGYPPGGFSRTIGAWAATIHPEDQDRVMAALEGHLKGVAPYDVEYRVRRRDGEWRWWSARGTALRDDRGEPYKMIGSITDITERKRAEEALHLAHERLRRFVDSNMVGVVIANSAGAVIEANDYYLGLIGYTREELERGSVDWRAITPPEWLAADEQSIRELRERGTCRPYEKEYLRRDGTRVSVFLADAMLPGPGEQIAAFALDITARKRAEEEIRKLNAELEQRVRDRTAQLAASNKELEAFSYSVSHDLRAPLRAIDGFARMLDEDYTARLDDEGRRLLATICGEAKRMGQLIDDLLAFSRMSRQQLVSAQIDMAALAQAVFDECVAQAPGRQLQFKVQPLPPGQGDRAMLRQALTNLCSNAIKYTRPRAVAEIEIGGRVEGDEHLYYVKDNGVGFDMSYANKLFGVFQRLHDEDEFEGTGVGLALVQRIIHRHGGRVWAEAKLNEGSTFYFTLPLKKEET